MMESAEIRARVVRTIGETLGIAPATLDDGSSPDTVAGWDSLKHIQLVLGLEEEFGVAFSDNRIMAMTSVALIVRQLHDLLA